MEVCSACSGSVLFADSKAFIALCRPIMSVLKQSMFEQEKEIID